MATRPTKRRRVEVTAREKREICMYKMANTKASLEDIGRHFYKEFGRKLGKSTVGDILRSKDKWLNFSEDSALLSRKRTAKNVELEEELFFWIREMCAQNVKVTDAMLLDKSIELGQQMNISDFTYSRGWIQRFKSRHSINKKTYRSDDNAAIINWREELKSVLAEYDRDDIFKVDETRLFFNLGPSQLLTDLKHSNEYLTAALCANSSGTEKMKALVISKERRPSCFGNEFDPELYVRYRFHTKALMTPELCQDWLMWFDRQMRLKDRKVVLLCDNAASHANCNRLTNVKLHFLPRNSQIQPSNAGIIRSFKAHYRQQLVKDYLDCLARGKLQALNVRQALRYVHEAWDHVTPLTIRNCFRHAQIFDEPVEDEEDIPLTNLREVLNKVDADDVISAEDYINIDKTEERRQSLTKIVIPVGFHQNEEENELKPITSIEARSHLDSLLQYFENVGDKNNALAVSSMINSFTYSI